jgi:hypothetical protein
MANPTSSRCDGLAPVFGLELIVGIVARHRWLTGHCRRRQRCGIKGDAADFIDRLTILAISAILATAQGLTMT